MSAERMHAFELEGVVQEVILVMAAGEDLIHIIYIIMLQVLMAILGVIIYHKPVLEAVGAAVQVQIKAAGV